MVHRLLWISVFVGVLALLGTPIVAQETTPAKGGSPEQRIERTIAPKSAPLPSLKYRLTPTERERVPGNAVAAYLRAQSSDRLAALRKDVATRDKINAWTVKAIAEEHRDELRRFIQDHRVIFQDLDLAACKEHCDWELESRLDRDGIASSFPELQGFRELSWLLQMRGRLAIAEGNFDEAQTTIRTGLRLAQHVSERPTLIQSFVGAAMAAVMLNLIDDWIAQPNAPNLYWALTALPHPLLHPQRGIEGEMRLINSMLEDVKDLESKRMTVPEANAALAKFMAKLPIGVGSNGGEKGPDLMAGIGQGVLVATQLKAAKRELIAQGFDAKRLDEMPPAQVVLLANVLAFQADRDDLIRWIHLPYPQAQSGMDAAITALKRLRGSSVNPMQTLAMMLPAVAKVHTAFGRIERRLAMLRTIEAIRMHAAANGGTFPKSLAEVTIVPVPNDPVLDKPLVYLRKEDRIELFAPAVGTSTWTSWNAVRYVLTIRKP